MIAYSSFLLRMNKLVKSSDDFEFKNVFIFTSWCNALTRNNPWT